MAARTFSQSISTAILIELKLMGRSNMGAYHALILEGLRQMSKYHGQMERIWNIRLYDIRHVILCNRTHA